MTVEDRKVYQVYQNMKTFLHDDAGCVRTVSHRSRNAVAESIANTGLTPKEHAEAMQMIRSIYVNSKTEQQFSESIEALNA